MLMNIPESFASNVLPSQQATVTPCFPRRSSKNCSQVQPRFPWSLCFALGPSAHKSLCVPFKNGVSISPNPWSSCTQAPLAFNARSSGSSFFQCQIPRCWGPDVGLRTLTLVGESLWYCYFLVCGASHPEGVGLLILHNHTFYLLLWPPSLSSGVGYLFESLLSIWLKVVQHLVIILLFFMRESELQSFYSTILILFSQEVLFLKIFYLEIISNLYSLQNKNSTRDTYILFIQVMYVEFSLISRWKDFIFSFCLVLFLCDQTCL